MTNSEEVIARAKTLDIVKRPIGPQYGRRGFELVPVFSELYALLVRSSSHDYFRRSYITTPSGLNAVAGAAGTLELRCASYSNDTMRR